MLFQLGRIFRLLDPITHFLVDICNRYEILEAVSKMLNWRKDSVYFAGTTIKFWPFIHAPGAGSGSFDSFPAQIVCRFPQLAECRNNVGLYQYRCAAGDFRFCHAAFGSAGGGKFDVRIFFPDCLYHFVYPFCFIFFQLFPYRLPDLDAVYSRTCVCIFRPDLCGTGAVLDRSKT